MKKIINMFAGLFCALFISVNVNADTNDTVVSPNAWVISLGGVGSTATTANNDTVFGADLSVGYTGNLLLPLEAGIRQGISYDSSAVFSTRVYADWTLFSIFNDRFDVFVGANAGVTYGDIQSVWTAAPEAGFRVWVKQDVAILARSEFPFRLNDGAEFSDSVRYFVGFLVKF